MEPSQAEDRNLCRVRAIAAALADTKFGGFLAARRDAVPSPSPV